MDYSSGHFIRCALLVYDLRMEVAVHSETPLRAVVFNQWDHLDLCATTAGSLVTFAYLLGAVFMITFPFLNEKLLKRRQNNMDVVASEPPLLLLPSLVFGGGMRRCDRGGLTLPDEVCFCCWDTKNACLQCFLLNDWNRKHGAVHENKHPVER